jgi:adenosylhomocysteinase
LSEDEKLGRLSFEWAKSHMPALVLAAEYLRARDRGKDLLKGIYLAACLHVSKETAVLIDGLRSFGLDIRLVAANPLSTQDNIVAFLRSTGIDVFAKSKESPEEYHAMIHDAARSEPALIVDDGAELHVAYSKLELSICRGGTDETTSGTSRLRALDLEGKLGYPVIPVNEAQTKHIFDNQFGSGQSTLDGLLRAMDLLIAGKCVVVAGFGWVGRGVAQRSRGMGARVIVTEVDGVKALEAHLDGFEVLSMKEAAPKGDVFLTCTGQIEVLREEHFDLMKDGAILGNVGHFDREIDTISLKKKARKMELVRNNVTRIEVGKKSLYLLCDGRVVNLVAAEGHPPEVMQLSFANQLLSLYYLVEHEKELRDAKPRLLGFPQEIDSLVTDFALKGFDLEIDHLTSSQKKYSQSK